MSESGIVVKLAYNREDRQSSTLLYPKILLDENLILSINNLGWNFVSYRQTSDSKKLINLCSWIRAQKWSNKYITVYGREVFDMFKFISEEKIDVGVGPDTAFIFYDTTNRWNYQLTIPNLVSTDEILNNAITKLSVRYFEKKEENIAYLLQERRIDSTKQINWKLSPLYIYASWESPHLEEAFSLLNQSTMTIISSVKKISDNEKTLLISDWINSVKYINKLKKGTLFCVPSIPSEYDSGFYEVSLPKNDNKALFKWPKTTLLWDSVGYSSEIVKSSIDDVRNDLCSLNGWEGIVIIKPHITLWGQPQIKIPIGNPSDFMGESDKKDDCYIIAKIYTSKGELVSYGGSWVGGKREANFLLKPLFVPGKDFERKFHVFINRSWLPQYPVSVCKKPLHVISIKVEFPIASSEESISTFIIPPEKKVKDILYKNLEKYSDKVILRSKSLFENMKAIESCEVTIYKKGSMELVLSESINKSLSKINLFIDITGNYQLNSSILDKENIASSPTTPLVL